MLKGFQSARWFFRGKVYLHLSTEHWVHDHFHTKLGVGPDMLKTITRSQACACEFPNQSGLLKSEKKIREATFSNVNLLVDAVMSLQQLMREI